MWISSWKGCSIPWFWGLVRSMFNLPLWIKFISTSVYCGIVIGRVNIPSGRRAETASPCALFSGLNFQIWHFHPLWFSHMCYSGSDLLFSTQYQQLSEIRKAQPTVHDHLRFPATYGTYLLCRWNDTVHTVIWTWHSALAIFCISEFMHQWGYENVERNVPCFRVWLVLFLRVVVNVVLSLNILRAWYVFMLERLPPNCPTSIPVTQYEVACATSGPDLDQIPSRPTFCPAPNFQQRNSALF